MVFRVHNNTLDGMNPSGIIQYNVRELINTVGYLYNKKLFLCLLKTI